ncbi:hypothetical protein GE21DRAFT_1284250 [Neurospora crassa]|nr:hypothetical protein GE21DRAFT_1284250 [Neurospora crassa]
MGEVLLRHSSGTGGGLGLAQPEPTGGDFDRQRPPLPANLTTPRQSPSRSSAEPVIVGHTMTFESTVISQFGLAGSVKP